MYQFEYLELFLPAAGISRKHLDAAEEAAQEKAILAVLKSIYGNFYGHSSYRTANID